MSKTTKQKKIESFFSNNNKTLVENGKYPKLINKHNQIEDAIHIVSSDDDKTPKKNKQNYSEIKENLLKLSIGMNPTTSKFKFKVSSEKSSSTTAATANSMNSPPTSTQISNPVRSTSSTTSSTQQQMKASQDSVFKKKSAFFNDDSSLDDIIPLSTSSRSKTTTTSEDIIKPQPLFRFKSKPNGNSKSLIDSESIVFKPTISSTQNVEKLIQDERERSIFIPKPISTVEKSSSQEFNRNTYRNTEISSPSSLKSSSSSLKLETVKSSTSVVSSSSSPSYSPLIEHIQISQQLSSALIMAQSNNDEIFDSPISSFYAKESIASNSSTPDAKKSPNNITMNSETIIKDCIDVQKLKLDNFNEQQLKNEKLKFLENYYNIHSQIALTHYDSIDGYDKKAVIRLKGTIQSLEMRLKRIRDRKSLEQKADTNSSNNYAMSDGDDDQFNLDEVMLNIEEENKKCNGKFNDKYVDLTNSSPSTNRQQFNPRINMREQAKPATITSQRALVDVYDEHMDADEDGFPIFDYNSLKDVVPMGGNQSSYDAPSTSREKSQMSKKNEKQTVDSMIPDNLENIAFKNTTSIGNFHQSVKNDGITGQFDGKNFEFSSELMRVFQNTFGLREFRQNQLQAINAALLGHDCFILMPTGGGKSLCYQLPALLANGTSIVISPLKSLILDQVNKLNSLDIKAAALSGDMSQADSREIYSDLNSFNPTIKLLYVTPEKISASSLFQNTLETMHSRGNLSRVVIDEAHCVTWGHDFRPDYKKLGELKRRFPKVPMMALTATANPRVRTDVVHQLNIYNCKWFLSSFNRPNLKYIVSQKTGAKTVTDIIALIKTKFLKASGIIYCLSRKECDSVAEKLQMSNIRAVSYHAGLTDKVREKVQTDWITDKYRVVCATIAFGMGIDKPDVRYVIHYSLPKSIEGYYQESGRAGRDGLLATCILYFSYADKCRYVNMMSNEPENVRQVSMNNLHLVVGFCENMIDCRRSLQLNYFGENFTRQQCLENRASACDNCIRVAQYRNIDVTEICKSLVNAVKDLCEDNKRFTVLQMVDVFKGAETKKVIQFNHHKTSWHGCLKTWDKTDIQRLLHKLIIENILREEITVINDIPISYLKLGKNVAQLMARNDPIQFALQEKHNPLVVKKKADVVASSSKTQQDDGQLEELRDRCYHELMDAAKAIADERGLTIQQVMNMEAIRQMSIRLPESEEEMLQIPHVTKANYMKYGDRFLQITIPYSIQRTMINELAADEANESLQDIDGDNDNNDGTNWDRIGRQASNSSINTGYKRKIPYRAKNVAKKFKRSAKKKSPVKKRSTATSATKKKTTAAKTGKQLLPPPKVTF